MSRWFDFHAMTQKIRTDKLHRVVSALHHAIVGHDSIQTFLVMSHWFEIHAMTQKHQSDKSHRIIPIIVFSMLIESGEINLIFPSFFTVGWFGLE